MVRISGHLLAIDPGSKKCGLAVVTNEGQVLKKMVVPIERLNEIISALKWEFSLAMILVGDRTNSRHIRECLTIFQLPVVVVDEDKSTVEGRYRYLKENTRGLARLIPIGLRIPKGPFDDYVAVVLAERYLKNNSYIAEGK